MVIATIRPFKFEAVRDALRHIGCKHFDVTEIQSYGHTEHVEKYRGTDYVVNFRPMTGVTVRVFDDASGSNVGAVVEAIRQAARTGKPGDGTIVVIDTESSQYIDNGEQIADYRPPAPSDTPGLRVKGSAAK